MVHIRTPKTRSIDITHTIPHDLGEEEVGSVNRGIEEVFCKKKNEKREFLIEWLPWIPQNQWEINTS